MFKGSKRRKSCKYVNDAHACGKNMRKQTCCRHSLRAFFHAYLCMYVNLCMYISKVIYGTKNVTFLDRPPTKVTKAIIIEIELRFWTHFICLCSKQKSVEEIIERVWSLQFVLKKPIRWWGLKKFFLLYNSNIDYKHCK